MSLRQKPLAEATLFEAARKNDLPRMEKYITGGGDLSEVDEFKMTLLHCAAHGGGARLVQLMLERPGIRVDPEDETGYTPLHYAAERLHLEVVGLLLDAGANANARDEMRRTPLHLVCGSAARGDPVTAAAVIKMLRAGGGNVTMKNVAGATPVDVAKANSVTDEELLAQLK